ncbi:MAG TPA: hypothetical protein VFQ88_06435 [Nevskiaceae bacterium]|nr:hypothetical protein [Nevskiaceae bacterium]
MNDTGTGGPEALLAKLDAALEDEQAALIAADGAALTAAAGRKLHTLQALDLLCRTRPAAITRLRTPLRQAAVANARNQALLSILRTRVESRMQALGLLDATYARDGRHVAPLSRRSVRL